MKKCPAFLGMLLLLCCILSKPAQAADEPWQEAYKDEIYHQSMVFDTPGGELWYGLYDVDGNSIPELFFGNYINTSIYTYVNGKVTLIGEVGDIDYIFPDKNAIWWYNETMDADGVHFVVESIYQNGRLSPGGSEVGNAYDNPTQLGDSFVWWSDYGIYGRDPVIRYHRGHVKTSNCAEDTSGAQKLQIYRIQAYWKSNKAHRVTGDLLEKITPRVINRQAAPSRHKFTVNRKSVSLEAYVIDGNNYCKLRDLAYALNGTTAQFNVNWIAAQKTVEIISGRGYTQSGGGRALSAKQAKSTSSRILIDGKYQDLQGYNIDGSNYFKLRDLQEYLDFEIDWDAKTSTVHISTSDAPADETSDTMAAYREFLENFGKKTISAPHMKFPYTNPITLESCIVKMEPDCFQILDLDGDGDMELLAASSGAKTMVGEPSCVELNAFLLCDYRDGHVEPLLYYDDSFGTNRLNVLPGVNALSADHSSMMLSYTDNIIYYTNGEIQISKYSRRYRDPKVEIQDIADLENDAYFIFTLNDQPISAATFSARYRGVESKEITLAYNTAANRSAILQ